MMRNFDTLREEFDRMSPEDQFRLGVSGVLRMAQNESDLTMPEDRMGYSPRNRKVKDDETDISKSSINEMSSGFSSKLYRVKITDAFQDIVAPMSLAMGAISDIEKANKNKHHHENILYQQGIISSIRNLGENNKQSFIRAVYLGYQSFLRHPMWSTFAALNDYIIKPIARLGVGALFGFGRKSDTQKIVEAIKQQTEYMRTGAIASPSTFSQLMSKGVVGYLATSMIDNIVSVFKGSDNTPNSPAIKTLDVLNEVLSANMGIFKTASEIEKNTGPTSMSGTSRLIDISQIYSVESLTAMNQLIDVNSSILETVNNHFNKNSLNQITTSMDAANDQVISTLQMTGSDSYRAIQNLNHSQGSLLSLVNNNLGSIDKSFNNSAEQTKTATREHFSSLLESSRKNNEVAVGYYERQLEEQMKSRKELQDHNKRERFRSTMKLLGGAGIKAAGLAALVAGAFNLLPDKISEAIQSGFKWLGGLAGGILSDVSSNLRPETLGMLIGGALMFTPMGRSIGIIVAGVSFLTSKLNDWFGTTSENVESERSARIGNGTSLRRAVEITDYVNNHPQVVQLESDLKTLRDTFFEMNESGIVTDQVREMGALINAKRAEIEVTREQIRTSRIRGQQLNQNAIDAAIGVGRNSGGSTISNLLSYVGQHESRGNYNALVYGRNTPSQANLTGMTIEEVMQYQAGMLGRGHASSAVGKYQFLQGTLGDAVANTDGVSKSDLFSPEVQDKLAEFLLNRRGLGRFENGELSPENFARNLADEWASLPLPNGRSAHEGIAGNKAGANYNEFMSVVRGMSNITASMAEVVPSSGRNPSISSQADEFSNSIEGAFDSLSNAIEGLQVNTGEQEERSNVDRMAVISEDSIRQLSRVLQNALEGFGDSQTINVAGIGD